MKLPYDNHYKTENLFGEPYPELIEFFASYPIKGKVLDMGCGQGRDAIAIARLGYEVIGIDNSSVGIAQMNEKAQTEKLQLRGEIVDIFEFEGYTEFDIILFDSMFHFYKQDKENEINLIRSAIQKTKSPFIIVFCVPDTKAIIATLKKTVSAHQMLHQLDDRSFKYIYEDKESGQKTIMPYRMIVVKK